MSIQLKPSLRPSIEPLCKSYLGVDGLIDIVEYASTFCKHGVSFNRECVECNHEEYVEGLKSSASAEADAMGRWQR